MKMKVLVTGATGFIGQHLCKKLAAKGHEVWAMARSKDKFNKLQLQNQAHLLLGDLDPRQGSVPSWQHSLPESLDAVIHLAGLVHSFRTNDFYQVNEGGTRLLIQALIQSQKKSSISNNFSPFHFIHLSSLAAAGPATSAIREKRETDPPNPVGHYGISKLQAEKVVEMEAPLQWKKTILRPPIVMGPGDEAFLEVFQMVNKRIFLKAGWGQEDKIYSFICVHDLVETILLSLENSQQPLSFARTYFVGHPQIITYRELIETLAQQMGKWPLRRISFPLPLLSVTAHFLAGLNLVFPVPSRLSPDKLKEIRENHWFCSSQESIQALGMKYQWDLTQTLQVTLDDYRQRGLLPL